MALRLQLTLKIPPLKFFQAGAARAVLHEEVARGIQDITEALAADVQARTPQGRGVLRGAIHARVVSGVSTRVIAQGKVFADVQQAPHAIFVEEGTRPHVIAARTKKALWWPGARHPVRRVNHPGTQGRWMFRDAWAAVKPRIPATLQAAVNRAARLLGGR